MELVKWAKIELDLLNKDHDPMQNAISKDILAVVKVFANQGHSGFSAAYALSILKRLLNWKPISPLTGEDSEWYEISNETEQNKRYSSVFRMNHDNKTAYDIDGKAFSDDGGKSWYTSRESRVPVTFPYLVPEHPEYVYVQAEEGETN